ncbi:hypothetical protein UA08_04693 [Talaromyces atroroseus]|uniref:Uncharacterized protein n=1 Tax=Talaromyces atroroseus TaxID=1441469 RepID=A0A225B054_TALAT|nr:hypothetical protein UA08_04693 [Talaromyces atroroseus]OKL60105.1 hypothetical protein UA08_04693 [Talaromyces atroroseus]
MCDHKEVTYRCGHIRILVDAWCAKYASTQKPCPPNIVARERRPDEDCDICKDFIPW